MSAVLAFPKNFLWGVELPPLDFLAQPENSQTILDVMARMPGGGMAHLVFDWACLEPEEGRFEAAPLAGAAEILRSLRSRGWRIMLTLTGLSVPPWASVRGGWSDPKILDRFDVYAAWCSAEIGFQPDYWGTVNRPVWTALGKPPWKPLSPREMWAAGPALANVLSSHGRSFRILKRKSPETPVGLCHGLDVMGALRPEGGFDPWIAKVVDRLANQSVLDALSQGWFASPFGKIHVPEAKGTLDFLGLAYRTRVLWTLSLAHPESCFMARVKVSGVPRSDGGEDIFPAGFRAALRRARGLGKPLFVLDNAVADGSDLRRPGHLVAHLVELHSSLGADPPVLGYVYGPILDGVGAQSLEGLFAQRGPGSAAEPRLSADLYAEIWRDNALPEILGRQFGAPLLAGEAL